MKRNEITILCVTTALLALVFVVLGLYGVLELSNKIDTSQLIQITITFVLMLVTVAYVKRTSEIARATKEQAEATRQQAEASVKMAKLMVKPQLIPYFRFTSDFDSGRSVLFEAGVDNDSNGPAYDIEFRVETGESKPRAIFSTGEKFSVLRGHQSLAWSMPDPRLHIPRSDVERRFFIVKYKDIEGEYEISLPFVLVTDQNDEPIARTESICRKMTHKANLEDDLP